MFVVARNLGQLVLLALQFTAANSTNSAKWTFPARKLGAAPANRATGKPDVCSPALRGSTFCYCQPANTSRRRRRSSTRSLVCDTFAALAKRSGHAAWISLGVMPYS